MLLHEMQPGDIANVGGTWFAYPPDGSRPKSLARHHVTQDASGISVFPEIDDDGTLWRIQAGRWVRL